MSLFFSFLKKKKHIKNELFYLYVRVRDAGVESEPRGNFQSSHRDISYIGHHQPQPGESGECWRIFTFAYAPKNLYVTLVYDVKKNGDFSNLLKSTFHDSHEGARGRALEESKSNPGKGVVYGQINDILNKEINDDGMLNMMTHFEQILNSN